MKAVGQLVAEGLGEGGDAVQTGDAFAVDRVVELLCAELGMVGAQCFGNFGQFHSG